MAIFSNFKNEKFHFKFQKYFFQLFSFQNFLDGTNEIFHFSFISSGMAGFQISK
jgi:hypothetical protein